MKRLTCEFYVDAMDEHRWRLKSRNGRIVADSGEGYSSRDAAERGFGVVQDGAPAARTVKIVGKKRIAIRGPDKKDDSSSYALKP